MKLITPGALRASLETLLPHFERQTGHKVSMILSPALAVPERLKTETFDIAIMGAGSAEKLVASRVLRSFTRIARSGVGAFVRRGDPKPDVQDADAFLRALKSAKVITYSDPGLGGTASNYVDQLLSRLDTEGDIKPKVKLAVEYRSIANIVAAGGVDIALNQIPEVIADPRLELAGPLPPPHQYYTDYVIGMLSTSDQDAVGEKLIEFLRSPAAIPVMRKEGFEPE
jgi:molybdate transport system substrate-binding protein